MRPRLLSLNILLLTLLVCPIARAQVLYDDIRLERIIIPPNSPEPLRFAAEELKAYLEKSVGADLPVLKGVPARGAFFITTPQLTPDIDKQAGGFTPETNRKFDRTLIAERQGCVYLIGENPRSALYAVYDLLQDRLGVRFYGPGAINEIVPVHKKLDLKPGLPLRKGSALEYRNYMSWLPQCHDFVAKNRINMIMVVEKEFGDNGREARKRGLLQRGPGHCWELFLPEKELFATHPEYFALRDGKRVVTVEGACFSKPEVRRIFVKKVGEYLRQHPYWDIFALWAADASYPAYCDCPECAKKTTGEWYLTLINEVAPVVERELPNGRFEFIAYHETRWPSKKPIAIYKNGKNMLLDLCLGYSRDLFHPLATRSGGSADVYEMYQAWHKRLKEIDFQGKVILFEYYNWCEVPNMGPAGRSLIWPMDVIRQDTQMYMKDGLAGLGDFTCLHNLGFPTPFNNWSWLQMYSTPDRSLTDFENDFYPAWFGTAGEAVRQYMNELRSIMYERTSLKNIARLEALGKKLEAIAAPSSDEAIARRLKVVKAHYDYCLLNKRVFLTFMNSDQAGWEGLRKSYENFFTGTHRDTLKDAIDMPPDMANMWYTYFVKNGPGAIKNLVSMHDLY